MTPWTVAGQRVDLPVELYPPDRDGPCPAVVVLSEAWGLNDDIRRIARRFAASGYLAAAPDLYRGRSWQRCIAGAMIAMQRGRGSPVADLTALVDAVAARDDVSGVGVVGFCMGGGFALLLGSRTDAEVAGVFYGAVSAGVDFASVCPVFAGYGGRDRVMAREYRILTDQLAAHRVPRDVAHYPEAGHSYMNEANHPILSALARPLMQIRYDAEAAEDSWRRMLAFFEAHLAR